MTSLNLKNISQKIVKSKFHMFSSRLLKLLKSYLFRNLFQNTFKKCLSSWRANLCSNNRHYVDENTGLPTDCAYRSCSAMETKWHEAPGAQFLCWGYFQSRFGAVCDVSALCTSCCNLTWSELLWFLNTSLCSNIEYTADGGLWTLNPTSSLEWLSLSLTFVKASLVHACMDY